MDTTTDPYDLLVDGMLSPHSDMGEQLFQASLATLVQEIAEDPLVLTKVITGLVDMIDTSLMRFGEMDDLSERVDFVRDSQALVRRALANYDAEEGN